MQRIDIVVAAYNAERTIRGCVQSLLNTEYADKKIIVVNDGSTDNTEKILKEFDDKIIVLNKPHGGVADARNFAVNLSSAKFIAFTDADCEVNPQWLNYALPHFQDLKVGAVTGWLHYKITNTLSAIRETEYALRFKNRSSKAHSVSCPVAMFRKRVLEEINGFDTGFIVGGEDTDVGYRICEKGYNIVYEKNMLAYHYPEEKLANYIKRNYRNGLNHFKLLKRRKRSIFFSDDFFPFILRLQPVFTAGMILSFLFWLVSGNLFWKIGFFICVLFILLDFIPVAVAVSRIKGILSMPYTFAILTLRNLVWLAALLNGISYLYRK